jgi:hypothetical protein
VLKVTIVGMRRGDKDIQRFAQNVRSPARGECRLI